MSASSVWSLHGVAPWAVLSDRDEVVPHVSQSAHIAELARDGLCTDKRVTRDDARFPSVLALWAAERGLIDAIVVAELADTGRQVVADTAIHVDLEHPIADLVTLSLGEKVLLWQGDLVGNWDVSTFEFSVL